MLGLAEAALLRLAARQSGEKQSAEAVQTLRRATALNPASLAPRLALLRELSGQSDWPAVEQEAREALAIDARSPDAHEALGVALMRLGRDQEAIEELKAAVALDYSPQAQALLLKLRKGQDDERSMKEESLGYFTLRYEGQAHEAVGSEILRALERHYATLTVTFGRHPSARIPVILFTEQAFYQATHAPRWSGGLYDNSDGRIRLPIGGLTTSLSPELDNVLIHELTHAFVADMSHGRAPLALHEGLAMHMEGKRLDEMLTRDQLRALADGQMSGVALTYLSGLAFAEYLIEQRGWGGVKDLLRAMGEGQEDAFQKVYGQTAQELGRATEVRLRQRYGS